MSGEVRVTGEPFRVGRLLVDARLLKQYEAVLTMRDYSLRHPSNEDELQRRVTDHLRTEIMRERIAELTRRYPHVGYHEIEEAATGLTNMDMQKASDIRRPYGCVGGDPSKVYADVERKLRDADIIGTRRRELETGVPQDVMERHLEPFRRE